MMFVQEAFASNWIAPAGPHLDEFEREFADRVGTPHAIALSSGTAALHLSMILAGITSGHEVICSTLSFVASANAVRYQGAEPVFVDSEPRSWNMDPAILEEAISDRLSKGSRIRAILVTHLYGQSADLDAIARIGMKYDLPIIEDAAEALGATYKGRSVGTFGRAGIFSFNGNKIITCGGGGMLVTADEDLAVKSRHLATQAKDPAPHYEHSRLGFNYRLSNVLAAIGRGQLTVLDERIAARQRIFSRYFEALSGLPGVRFMPQADYGTATRWLTCLTIDPEASGTTTDMVRRNLERADIEARPIWKPLHLQPLYSGCSRYGSGVSDELFRTGLCLPSGSALTESDLDRVIEVIQKSFRN